MPTDRIGPVALGAHAEQQHVVRENRPAGLDDERRDLREGSGTAAMMVDVHLGLMLEAGVAGVLDQLADAAIRVPAREVVGIDRQWDFHVVLPFSSVICCR